MDEWIRFFNFPKKNMSLVLVWSKVNSQKYHLVLGSQCRKNSFLFQKHRPHIFKEAIRSETDERQTDHQKNIVHRVRNWSLEIEWNRKLSKSSFTIDIMIMKDQHPPNPY